MQKLSIGALPSVIDSRDPLEDLRDYVGLYIREEILAEGLDTLIGHTLPAFLATKKRKALSTSKFYLFDCGVTNALIGRREIAAGTPEFGKLLEQALFNELKCYLDYKRIDKKIEYWRSTSQFEVDFLVYGHLKEIVAIEVKAGKNPSLVVSARYAASLTIGRETRSKITDQFGVALFLVGMVFGEWLQSHFLVCARRND